MLERLDTGQQRSITGVSPPEEKDAGARQNLFYE